MNQSVKSNPYPQQQHEKAGQSPVKTPAAGKDQPDAGTQAAGFASRQTPETIAGKTPTGLPPIERGDRGAQHGDPVRRAAERITSLDNANMAATDNAVDVDGKGLEARREASPRQDNVIHSNASLDEATRPPAEGLGGIDSQPPSEVLARPGWRVENRGTVTVEHTNGERAERVFSFERSSH
ncbi:DUF3005 domain-containing protein [Burkholderia glumae]|uniref:DUF3005 domain-containing protein n=1 Tax=Burkholderia glumae TaxID=337 RepID=UPI0002F5AA9A|nr:DUF3005 domain-containing protein [Burkholderia glumae]MCM2493336.1 DUF3005 domain-containing protein [Burkholderia glumae]MCM2544078.1 DUF3005 domain-containing protein [Burkholderia glumae]MCR1766083.1 DUF3005 domain-containing protein [Burkholderia glumae]PJO25085.1 DUF3005 domain-containing protein [Burkholderia glumae AU6208]QHE09136.1 DUF3005 domain-containing protein [Burkholderia glumae AU6208]